MPGAHGLCRASFGKAREGLEEKVPGVRTGLAGCALVPSAVEVEPLWPRPGSLQASPFGAVNPAEPPVWLGALWTSCAAVGSGKAPCASSLGLARRRVFLGLRKVHVCWLSRVLTCSRTLLIAAPGRISQRPPANPVGELGALQLRSAAPLGARRSGRLRADPARRRLRGRRREPAACPRTAGCGLSHPGLVSYSLAELPAGLLAEAGSEQLATTVAKSFGACIVPVLTVLV